MKKMQLTNIKFSENPNFYLSEDALIYPEEKMNQEKIIAPEFLNKFEEIKTFQKEVHKYYNLILPVFTEFMNQVHSEKETSIYWERITGFWLISIISNYLDKYKRLEIAFKKEDCLKTQSIAFRDFQTPETIKEYFNILRGSSFFHLQQYSTILEEFYKAKTEFLSKEADFFIEESSQLDRTHKPKKSIKQKLREKFLSLLDCGYESKKTFYVSLFSNKDLFIIFLKSGFQYAPVLQDEIITIKEDLNVSLREKIKQYSTRNNLADAILHSSVQYFLPIEMFEGYLKISFHTSKLIDKILPNSIFTGIGFMWSTQFAVWAAKCASKGTILYGMQHGGTYGEVEILDGEFLERKLTDHYITWGWIEDEKTIPMPASRLLSKSLVKPLQVKNQILWVTTADSRFNYFVGQIGFGNRFLKYFQHQQELYKLLSPKIQSIIKIRLYSYDFGWKMKQRWTDSFPRIEFADTRQNFIDQAAQSELVVIDHLGGTTFLELLTLNIPVVVIANADLFVIRKGAKSFYDLLEENGVIYKSNEKAAKALPKIIEDVASWWSEKERRQAIENFKSNFALTSDKPLKTWFEFLKK